MKERNLRFIFVQLLFSLAIGQVAVKVSDLISEGHYWECSYAYAHLALCVVILSTSWVGYQISTATATPLTTIFSVQFIILLLDLFLVVTYFVIVRGAEIKNYPKDGHIGLASPDMHNETIWSIVIFAIYFLWDVVTKLLKTSFVEEGETYIKKYPTDFSEFSQRAKITVSCLALSCFTCVVASKSNSTQLNVILIDCALIFLFFWFRGLKQELKSTYRLSAAEMGLPQEEFKGNEILEIVDAKYPLKWFLVKIFPIIGFAGCILFVYFSN